MLSVDRGALSAYAKELVAQVSPTYLDDTFDVASEGFRIPSPGFLDEDLDDSPLSRLSGHQSDTSGKHGASPAGTPQQRRKPAAFRREKNDDDLEPEETYRSLGTVSSGSGSLIVLDEERSGCHGASVWNRSPVRPPRRTGGVGSGRVSTASQSQDSSLSHPATANRRYGSSRTSSTTRPAAKVRRTVAQSVHQEPERMITSRAINRMLLEYNTPDRDLAAGTPLRQHPDWPHKSTASPLSSLPSLSPPGRDAHFLYQHTRRNLQHYGGPSCHRQHDLSIERQDQEKSQRVHNATWDATLSAPHLRKQHYLTRDDPVYRHAMGSPSCSPVPGQYHIRSSSRQHTHTPPPSTFLEQEAVENNCDYKDYSSETLLSSAPSPPRKASFRKTPPQLGSVRLCNPQLAPRLRPTPPTGYFLPSAYRSKSRLLQKSSSVWPKKSSKSSNSAILDNDSAMGDVEQPYFDDHVAPRAYRLEGTQEQDASLLVVDPETSSSGGASDHIRERRPYYYYQDEVDAHHPPDTYHYSDVTAPEDADDEAMQRSWVEGAPSPVSSRYDYWSRRRWGYMTEAPNQASVWEQKENSTSRRQYAMEPATQDGYVYVKVPPPLNRPSFYPISLKHVEPHMRRSPRPLAQPRQDVSAHITSKEPYIRTETSPLSCEDGSARPARASPFHSTIEILPQTTTAAVRRSGRLPSDKRVRTPIQRVHAPKLWDRDLPSVEESSPAGPAAFSREEDVLVVVDDALPEEKSFLDNVPHDSSSPEMLTRGKRLRSSRDVRQSMPRRHRQESIGSDTTPPTPGVHLVSYRRRFSADIPPRRSSVSLPVPVNSASPCIPPVPTPSVLQCPYSQTATRATGKALSQSKEMTVGIPEELPGWSSEIASDKDDAGSHASTTPRPVLRSMSMHSQVQSRQSMISNTNNDACGAQKRSPAVESHVTREDGRDVEEPSDVLAGGQQATACPQGSSGCWSPFLNNSLNSLVAGEGLDVHDHDQDVQPMALELFPSHKDESAHSHKPDAKDSKRASTLSFGCQVADEVVATTRRNRKKSQSERLRSFARKGNITSVGMEVVPLKFFPLEELPSALTAGTGAPVKNRKKSKPLAITEGSMGAADQKEERRRPARFRQPPLRWWMLERIEYARPRGSDCPVAVGVHRRTTTAPSLTPTPSITSGQANLKQREKPSLSHARSSAKKSRLRESSGQPDEETKREYRSLKESAASSSKTTLSKKSSQTAVSRDSKAKRARTSRKAAQEPQVSTVRSRKPSRPPQKSTKSNETAPLALCDENPSSILSSQSSSPSPRHLDYENQQIVVARQRGDCADDPQVVDHRDVQFVPIQADTGFFEVAIMFETANQTVCELMIHPGKSKGIDRTLSNLLGLVVSCDTKKCLLQVGQAACKLKPEEAEALAKKSLKKAQAKTGDLLIKDVPLVRNSIETSGTNTEDLCFLLSRGHQLHIPPMTMYNFTNLSKYVETNGLR